MKDATCSAVPAAVLRQEREMEQQLNAITTDQERETGAESVIPEDKRNNDCSNGIIAQGKNFTVIQNHGNKEGVNENIYYQFCLTMNVQKVIPSLATNENKVATGDSEGQKHHPFMQKIAEFCLHARKSRNPKVKILTAKQGNNIKHIPEVWNDTLSNNKWKQMMEYDYDPDATGGNYSKGNLMVILFINIGEYKSVGNFMRYMIPFLDEKKWWLDSANGPTKAINTTQIRFFSKELAGGVFLKKLQSDFNNAMEYEYWVDRNAYSP